MTNLTIYHNPRCSKSRQTLELIRQRDIEPTIIHYLEQPPTPDELAVLVGQLSVSAHGLIRAKESQYSELGLSEETPDEELLAQMSAHPKLIERPIVTDGQRAVLGRPPENVEQLLP